MWRETLPGLLFTQAEARPDAVALREKQFGIWVPVTWREFSDRVRWVAMALDDAGIGTGDYTAIVAENETSWLYADLGAQLLGAISAAAYPMQVAAEVAFILRDTGSRLVFCGDQEQVDKVLATRDELPDLEKIVMFDMKGVREYQDPMIESFEEFLERGRALDEQNPERTRRLVEQRHPDETAFVGYTSGTTGQAKGALLKHRSQVSMARSLADWGNFTAKELTLSHFPLCHPAVRVNDIYTSLVTGGSINFPETAESVQEDMYEIAPTFLLGSPRVYELMKAGIETRMERAHPFKRRVFHWGVKTLQAHLEALLEGGRGRPIRRFLAYWLVGYWLVDKLGLRRLRFAACGGAATSPELLKFFWSLGVGVRETYGQSETSGIAFAQAGFEDIGTAGAPLPGIEAKIDPTGELMLRGEGIFSGYLNLPDETEKVFAEGGWYRTGDLATLDEQGRLIMLDREKHLMQTSIGGSLSPSEIENKLKLSPYVADAMVMGDDEGYVTALIQIEYETVSEWAQRRNLAFTTFKSLTEMEEVKALLSEAVEQANSFLPEEKRVQDFRMFPRELDPDMNEITPTRKIKRPVVTERFQNLVDEMYSADHVSSGPAPS